MNILLINYGTSNINSIYNALKKVKKINVFVNDFNIKKIDKIIFPGQGHINNSINFLNKIENLNYYLKNKMILGICIGYHIFFNKSEEDIKINCLNYINGDILKISKNCCFSNKIPNIGWLKINLIRYHKIFKNIPNSFYQYFMHSYSSIYKNQSFSYSVTKFENVLFNSIIIKENKFLFQFHPEKSGKIGLKIIQNFLNL